MVATLTLFSMQLVALPSSAAKPDTGFLLIAQNSQPAGGPNGGNSGGTSSATLAGFAETPWNSTYSDVYNRMKNLATSNSAVEDVEILQAVRNQTILVKRNEVLYRYNFYKTPYPVVILTEHQLKKDEWDAREGVLFHVKVTPSFIASGLIEKKLSDLYGPKTRSTVDKKNQRGAIVWVLPAGLIFQWVEPYRHEPYTRTIDYMSKELTERILKEFEDFFDAPEKKILQEIILG